MFLQRWFLVTLACRSSHRRSILLPSGLYGGKKCSTTRPPSAANAARVAAESWILKLSSHQVNDLRLRMFRGQLLRQRDEQQTVLAIGPHPRQHAAARVQRTGEIARLTFCPGVITSFCLPRFIQSGPILGLR